MNFSPSFDVIPREFDDEHELWFSSLCSFLFPWFLISVQNVTTIKPFSKIIKFT